MPVITIDLCYKRLLFSLLTSNFDSMWNSNESPLKFSTNSCLSELYTETPGKQLAATASLNVQKQTEFTSDKNIIRAPALGLVITEKISGFVM